MSNLTVEEHLAICRGLIAETQAMKARIADLISANNRSLEAERQARRELREMTAKRDSLLSATSPFTPAI